MVDPQNILITGSAGQLGRSIKFISNKYNNFHFYFTNKDELDITNFNLVENFLIKYKIDKIINCAAYTNLELCEKNKQLADKINNHAVDNLAKLSEKMGLNLIHISTDYVFDGSKKTPYNENDKPNPINYYGISKSNGENKILNYKLNSSAIIRTSWLYSKYGNNFVKKITKKLKFNKSISIPLFQVGSPTYSIDLAKVILNIINRLKNTQTEIFHFSNSGSCSRFHFTEFIKKSYGFNTEIIPIFRTNSTINRPKYSVLNCDKISTQFDFEIKCWEDRFSLFVLNNKIK